MELNTLVKIMSSKLLVVLMHLMVFAFMCITGVHAATYSETVRWAYGVAAGSPAATCTYSIPDNLPFSVPRTLLVDTSIQNSTVIYSWDYNDFIQNYTVSCIGSGIKNSDSYFLLGNGANTNRLRLVLGTSSQLKTNNAGLFVNLYVMYNQDSIVCDNCVTSTIGNNYKLINGLLGHGSKSGFTDYLIVNSEPATLTIPVLSSPGTAGQGNEYWFDANNAATGSFSIKAEIVKFGTVVYDSASTPLTFNKEQAYLDKTSEHIYFGPAQGLLGENGVNISKPACQLKTQHYAITMPVWVALGANTLAPYSTLPARGSETPVDLSLECSGQVPNVRFKFEDTGSSVLSSKNISLYDSAAGDKVDGLEIEMLYKSAHVDIDNSTKMNVGTHGQTKTTPSDSFTFDSVSTVDFTARFIQTAAITKNGNAYTGPVTGKVNMWVTYD